MITPALAATGRRIMDAAEGAGSAVILAGRAMMSMRQMHRSLAQLKQQIDMAGFGSLLVLALISGLTGMIMVMQMGPTLANYNALNTIGGIIGVTFFRELGPIW
ncbi:MAG: ABC transporter permease, partial [Planctomycetota bacterium]|nr:ABC transporter permease [Planctomycetota bacterium]